MEDHRWLVWVGEKKLVQDIENHADRNESNEAHNEDSRKTALINLGAEWEVDGLGEAFGDTHCAAIARL